MPSDEEIMRDLATKNQSALGDLYERYSSLLYSSALRIMGDRGSAEEVLQDTFFQLWLKASQFDPSKGSLIGWLLTLVRRRAISRMRIKRDEFYCEPLNDGSVSLPPGVGVSLLEQQIARELVSLALNGLSNVQREAIILAYFEGLTCEEISSRTGVPSGTIKHRVRSALRKMKRSLETAESPRRGEHRPEIVTLEDILVTDLLSKRPCRSRTAQLEDDCRLILKELSSSPKQLVDAFLQIAITLCRAGTAGLSFLESNEKGDHIFRWTNLAGQLKRYVGGSTPRDFSPCGVTLDRRSPQLFSYPARYFHYFRNVEVPIVEGLVIPFHVGTSTEGTIWIVSHKEGEGFDAEDARIMMSLGEFVGCTLHISKSVPAEL